MDDIQIKCALAKMSKKITDYQKYVDREIHEFKNGVELQLNETLEQQKKIAVGDFE